MSDIIGSNRSDLGVPVGIGKTIEYVVKNYLNERGNYTTVNYERYCQMVIDCLQFDLNLFHLPSVRVVYLPMNQANIIPFPDDMVRYCKIGINIGGRMWTLTMNPDLLIPKAELCGLDINNLTVNGAYVPSNYGSLGGYYFTSHYRNGQFVGGLYGAGGGLNVGYYNIDYENKRIILSANIPRTYIVLEYITSGISAATLVPNQAVNPCKEYLYWRENKGDNRVGANKIENYKEDFYEAVDKLRNFELSMNISEYLDSLFTETLGSINR